MRVGRRKVLSGHNAMKKGQQQLALLHLNLRVIVRFVPVPLSAVVFDYGDVLCLPQRIDDIARMAALLDIGVAEFQNIYWRDRLAYDAGKLEPDTYWNAVRPDLTPRRIGQLIDLDNHSWSDPNPVMAAWAADLRGAGIKTAILSNMPVPMRQHIEQECTWLPEFDLRVFSCDVGATKPGAAIYQHCLAGLKVERGQVLFLDDKLPNVDAARSVGMHAIQFQDGGRELAAELRRKFVLPSYPDNLLPR
jgi:putative hydrolase of the HAD superfamily